MIKSRGFYLCTIVKVTNYLCTIKNFKNSSVPSSKIFFPYLPFRPPSVSFLPFTHPNASAHTLTPARVRRRRVGLLPASVLTPAGAELAFARASASQGKPRPHARPRRPEGWLHEAGASELRPPPPPDGSSVPAAVGRGAQPQFRRGAANLGARELDPLGPTAGEHPPPAS